MHTADAAYPQGSPPHPEGSSGASFALNVMNASEPFESVLSLGKRAHRWANLFLVLAVGLHAGAAAQAATIPLEMQAWTKAVAARVHEVIWTEVDLEVIKEAEPPPPAPPPEPEPVKAEPAPPPPAALKEVPKEAPAAPPPAAAQAGAVLAAPSDPDEPVDLTGAFVQGTGDSYAGGTTQATGTSKSAVRDPNARGTGVQGGTGTGPAAPAVNLSRPASCASESLWRNCPFPAEADTAQVDEAFVLLRATVESSGTISAVTILEDPGNGFGREAKRWALATVKCQPALDASGTAVSGQSTVRVRFNRD